MKFERLGNIITIAKGKKPTFAESPNENSIRVLQIDDLRNDNNIKYTDDKSGVFAKEDDVILAWDGANAGTIGFGKTGFIGSTLAVLRKSNSKDFDTVFIGKFLQTQFDFLRSKSTGATIPHINRISLESLKIPCLTLSDQIQIANILSKAETLIGQRKQSIALLDEFLKSTFLEMFGDPVKNKKVWEKDKIGSKCKVTKLAGYEYTKHVKYTEKGEIIVVKGLNVKNGRIKLDNISFIDRATSDFLIRSKLFKGDVVMTYIGINIGDVAIVEIDNKFHLAPNVCKITPLNFKITNSYFLLYYLMYNRRLFVKGTTDTAKPSINMSEIREIEILLPPIELQTQFATIVTKTEALKEQYKNSLQELENLYGSLSQKAFKGELEFSKEVTAQ